MPVEHRPDFKQALSTLQQLKQKEEGSLQTSTNSRRNQQWAQSSSSSSWWSWQGSWWTPHSYASHDGDEPSTDWTKGLVIQVFGTILQGMTFLNSIICYRWIVHSWWRSTVTDGRCKYHTSNDVFSRCKSVHKMATRKSDDQSIQPDNKMRIWTKSGKLRIDHECVVTMHDVDTNDNMFTIVHDCVVTLHDAYTNDNYFDHFYRLPQWLSMSAHCLVLSCLYIVTRTRTVAQVMSLSHHPHVHVHVNVSPRLALPFLFPALPAALLPLPPALEVRRLQPAAHSAQRGYGLVWRVPPHRSYWPIPWGILSSKCVRDEHGTIYSLNHAKRIESTWSRSSTLGHDMQRQKITNTLKEKTDWAEVEMCCLTTPLGKQVLWLCLSILAHPTLSKLDGCCSFKICRWQVSDTNFFVSEILTHDITWRNFVVLHKWSWSDEIRSLHQVHQPPHWRSLCSRHHTLFAIDPSIFINVNFTNSCSTTQQISLSKHWARDPPTPCRTNCSWRRREIQTPDLNHVSLEVYVPNACILLLAIGGCRVASEPTPCLHVCSGKAPRSWRSELRDWAARNHVSMWITLHWTDGDRWWMRIDMLSAKRSAKILKGKTGRNCAITTMKWEGQQESKAI